MSSDEISGPSFGNGAPSLVCAGRRPVGGCTTGPGAGMAGCTLGGGTLASGALQGVALADGAVPIATVSPIAAADAIESAMLRRIADM